MSTQLTKLIKVKDDTYERLSDKGKKNETYDDVIRKLLDFYDSKNKKWVIKYQRKNGSKNLMSSQ